jgi:hypothetical protein
MLLATLLLLFPVPQNGDVTEPVDDLASAVSSDTKKDLFLSPSLLSMPESTLKADPEPTRSKASAQPFQPSKPTFRQPHESPRQRKLWYGLAVAGHTGAAFDAWSTRRAVSGGYGQEANPLLRPFAHSNFIYAATQISPAVMDFLGKRMMRSQHRWVRRMWWLPQTAGTGFSFAAGAHNVGVVH